MRLLKKFSPKHFEPKSSRLGDDDLDAEPLKRGQITEQLVELPIEHQVYEMIDAAGSKGLTVLEVCAPLSLNASGLALICWVIFFSEDYGQVVFLLSYTFYVLYITSISTSFTRFTMILDPWIYFLLHF